MSFKLWLETGMYHRRRNKSGMKIQLDTPGTIAADLAEDNQFQMSDAYAYIVMLFNRIKQFETIIPSWQAELTQALQQRGIAKRTQTWGDLPGMDDNWLQNDPSLGIFSTIYNCNDYFKNVLQRTARATAKPTATRNTPSSYLSDFGHADYEVRSRIDRASDYKELHPTAMKMLNNYARFAETLTKDFRDFVQRFSG